MLILQPRLSNFKTLVLGSCNRRDFDMDHRKRFHPKAMYIVTCIMCSFLSATVEQKNASAKNVGKMWKLFKPHHPLHFREIHVRFSNTAPYPQVPSLQRWPNIVAVPGVSVGPINGRKPQGGMASWWFGQWFLPSNNQYKQHCNETTRNRW